MARDPEGFEEQFERLAAIAYRVAFRLLGQREEARDVAQEAMARAFARWRRVGGYADAWVARVATNLALGHLRRRPPAELAGEPVAPDQIDRVGERAELADAIRGLPRRQREVVALRYLADLSEAEVARVLGCSVGTVKSHTHRAMTGLRSALGGQLDVLGGTA
jgi:RNA polymerase sigma-70 factor (ECF subfamily)